jgi:glycogen(starch) synthase
MFGWELPPYNSGGLGTASLGLTQSLSELGVDIDFVLPKVHGPFPFSHMRIHGAAGAGDFFPEAASVLAYGTSLQADDQGSLRVQYAPGGDHPAPYLHAHWYAARAQAIASQTQFEVVHAHDWMTYYSGMRAQQVARRRGIEVPLVAHIHATEYDRGGEGGGNRAIAAIERAGFEAADRIVAVSHYTAAMVRRHYGISASKISVVHNGITPSAPARFNLAALKKHYKIVLFMGRVTMSKGPEYFLKLARDVTAQDPKVKFVMVGSGDLEHKMIEQAAHMGLTGKILFSSFLRGQDVDRAYQLADLFVMPSVSEPFGLVALEALQNGTPAIVSKQSGVAEVSNNLVQVDFWDAKKMRDTVLELLQNPAYAQQLTKQGQTDLAGLSWDVAAHKMQEIYESLLPRQLAPAYADA